MPTIPLARQRVASLSIFVPGISTLALALGAAYALPVFAETLPVYIGTPILVTATRLATPDVEATYASEIHTREMIEASGATSLVDYLAQHTALNVMPNFGNRFTPQIDMRGYGYANGNQNLVISLDGQRLNNIDMQPQLLGAIPLSSIQRIEITRGSGSVVYGDGATAGSIQIYTHPYQGFSAAVEAGNFGALNGTLAAGLSRDNFSLSASSDYQSSDGTSDPDVTGHRDASRLTTQRGQLRFRPFDPLWLTLEGSTSRIDTRYVGHLTQAELDSNPAQNGGNTYTHQKFDSDQWRVGAAYQLSQHTQLTASHNQENKLSDYVSYAFKANYDYTTDDIALLYEGDTIKLTTGVQRFDGTRIGASDRTSKNNLGYYFQGEYQLNKLSLSAGARREKVEYEYVPMGGVSLHDSEHLNAWDIGSNYRFNEKSSVFANYNQSFQAPDIDRFFNFGGTFNAFISPQKVKTLTIGLNHATDSHRMKLSVFRANLQNEIYFYVPTFTNTNIDKSHKYGLELQDVWRIRPNLNLTANYTYTRAVIDHENEGGGAYDGKNLPGVPRHGVTLGLNYQYSERSTFNLGHVWRSESYATNDFANNFTQRQRAYQSTNFSYRYHYKHYEFLASVDNLFAHTNGLWVQDNAVYPVNFTRNFRVGFKTSF